MSEVKVKAENEMMLDWRTALYHAGCKKCGERLWWEADFDADGCKWHAECCDYYYTLTTPIAEVSVE